ncbi:aldehyde dehydrogenase family protein [Methanosarcina hadiensis]
MKVLNIELFGPIAPVVMAKDEDEAVKIVNSAELVFGAEVWSANKERAKGLAKRIRASFITINGKAKPDPRLLFGSLKKSSIGREFSHYGLKEFVNMKTIVVSK